MKKRILVCCLGVAVLAVAATAIAQVRLSRYLEENYGRRYEYYQIGDVVEFGDNYQFVAGYGDSLDGYSIQVDAAEVLTYEEFLERAGQTEERAATLLKNIYSLPEKVCLISTTLSNKDSNARGVSLSDLYCTGDTYDMYFDSALTIVANSFLLEAQQKNLEEADGFVSVNGVYLDPGESTTVYLVYDFTKSFFTAQHWESLSDETLQLQITNTPVTKVVELSLK